LESAYTACLVHELRKLGLEVQTEVPVPLIYDGLKLPDVGYRLDILVSRELVVEVKAVEAIAPLHVAQLVSYLKLADKRLGLLLNFNVEWFRDGIYRRVNKL
jgi:GxxExxY protein